MKITNLSPTFSQSQKQLIALARESIKDNCEIEYVRIERGYTGATFAAKWARRNSENVSAIPRSVVLCGVSQWETVMSLIKLAGRDCWGAGYIDILTRCLKKMAGPENRELCLWVDRAGAMTPLQQETLAYLIDYVADQINAKVRIVYLLQMSLVWNAETRRRERKHVRSLALSRRARVWDFSAEGFDELINGSKPETSEGHEREPAIAAG